MLVTSGVISGAQVLEFEERLFFPQNSSSEGNLYVNVVENHGVYILLLLRKRNSFCSHISVSSCVEENAVRVFLAAFV